MSEIKLSGAGIARALAQPGVTEQTKRAAETVAGSISETAGDVEIPVTVRSRETLGARFVPVTAWDVSLAHPAGLAVQAKRGALTRGAAAAGLSVTEKPAGT